jgi:predicted HicB family RNase H-like nuclease
MSDFIEAVEDYLKMCSDEGIEPQKTYRGKFNVRVSPELHRTLAKYSAAHGQTLNSVVEEAIRRYVAE